MCDNYNLSLDWFDMTNLKTYLLDAATYWNDKIRFESEDSIYVNGMKERRDSIMAMYRLVELEQLAQS